MADQKLSAISEVSVPDFNDDIYLIDDTGPTSNKCGTDRLFGLAGTFPGGRLTLESGVPISTTDQTAKTNIFYTPYIHNKIQLWDGTRWLQITFTEYTLALGTLTSAKPYDVFAYYNSGALALESLVWTDDTSRATSVTLQDGRYAKNGDKTRLYLGTFYTTSTTTTEDSLLNRYLFNMHNRAKRKMKAIDSTDSWQYTTAAWRQANNNSANQVNFVIGAGDQVVRCKATAIANGSVAASVEVSVGIGIDSTTVTSSEIMGANTDNLIAGQIWGEYLGYPGTGKHYLAWLERSNPAAANTTTWYGDAGGPTIYQSGIIGELLN